MRTLQNLWDTFSNRFSNFPIQFNDDITPDGIAKSWELTFYPISDVTAFTPLVLKNIGSVASPNWVTLVENTDYTINYITGQITFTTIPASMMDGEDYVVTIKVIASHLKINLRQFIQFFNEITGQMQIFWPVTKYIQVLWSDIGLGERDTISEIDLNHAFWDQKNILEIFQEERDGKHILFEIRGKTLLLLPEKNSPRRPINLGPTDYNRTWSGVIRGTVTTPFYLSYIQKYPIFTSANPNDDLAEDTLLDIQNNSEVNASIRIALAMYTMREHWSERINASTLRLSTLKDIQMTKQSVSIELMRHTWDNAPGRGNTPPTTFSK